MAWELRPADGCSEKLSFRSGTILADTAPDFNGDKRWGCHRGMVTPVGWYGNISKGCAGDLCIFADAPGYKTGVRKLLSPGNGDKKHTTSFLPRGLADGVPLCYNKSNGKLLGKGEDQHGRGVS